MRDLEGDIKYIVDQALKEHAGIPGVTRGISELLRSEVVDILKRFTLIGYDTALTPYKDRYAVKGAYEKMNAELEAIKNSLRIDYGITRPKDPPEMESEPEATE